MYMANMAWNSAMNTAETMRMLTDKDPATGEYKIPRIIYSDAYYSETVAYADLVLPDTTYLERWDCISLLDRPIGGVDGPADSIRQPVLAPDRDVRPFQDVLIELGARLGLPGFIDAGGRAALSRLLPRLYRQPRAPAGHRAARRLARRRGRCGRRAAPPTRTSSTAMSPTAASGSTNCRRSSSISSTPTRPISTAPPRWASSTRPNRSYCSSMSSRCSASASRRRGTERCSRPTRIAQRIAAYFDPLPFWYAPFEEARVDRATFPLHAMTQRPMQMYHSWHSQNAWLRQILGHNRLFVHRATGRALGLADDDWVWVVEPSRPHSGADQADGRGQPRHGVDLERDRQARRGLEPRRRLAGIPPGAFSSTT